ncbi:hypothetical protein HO173_003339 [Letharia columbiana]|uniref:Uncharacterized protein n=1 Tax=Letharia columbiana TaxID=112416 RepID=A0A8H6G1Q8_9LECA|nr:uncharacterized protein HO173_003339 [Letharia columbiana]KAF6238832.1 hypothetical protein HO173_003339 [Letharia columbiana]
MNLDVVQQRKDQFAAKQFEQQFRSMCHLGPAIFEDTKRGRSPVKKKATAPPTPGLLRSLSFAVPEAPRRLPRRLHRSNNSKVEEMEAVVKVEAVNEVDEVDKVDEVDEVDEVEEIR